FFQKALKQAQLWPRQNHLLLGVLLLFGLAVFLDLAVGLTTVPSLIKRLFGIETAFTRSRWSFLNTTFLATLCGLTYLCLDPLIKAVYLLRCFYGESLHTGEDLRAALKQFQPGAAATVVALFILLSGSVPPGTAAPSAIPNPELRTPNSEISPPDLDRSIEQVLSRREFNWRLPRQNPAGDKSDKGFFAAFMDGLIETLRSWAKAIGTAVKAVARWVADALDWLRDMVFGKRAR